MFRTRLIAVLLVLSAFLFSCSGEDGATGPAGANGKDGNANVVVYEYGSRTTTSGAISYVFTATRGFVDSCLVLGYYNPSNKQDNMWYPVPGLGPDAVYQVRSFWWQTNAPINEYTYDVRLMNPNGTGSYTTSTTFTKLKIYLVPASTITPLTSRGLLDLSDYNAVREYLNLPE